MNTETVKFDGEKRVVSLSVLEQLCEQASSTCHRYEIINVSEDRVKILYSNPDEYGYEHPLYAYLPYYRGAFDAEMIILDFTSIEGGIGPIDREQAWQKFDTLFQTEYNPENLD